MKLITFVLSLFCWLAVPGLSYAEDGHKHAKGEQHTEGKKDDDHSGHAHGKSKRKTKKKHDEKGHDHSEDDDHSEEDGHKHDKSSSNETGNAHGEDHVHSESEEGAHGDEEEHAHSEESEHGDGEQHAHSEEGGHDDHGEEGDHDEHGASGIGPGKAIIEVANEGNKFKLSKEAEEFLQVKTMNIEALGGDQYKIPNKVVVTYQKNKSIYIKSGDWFEIKDIKVLNSDNEYLIVSINGLNANTLVASAGLGFLRAAHLQASGQGGKGHAH